MERSKAIRRARQMLAKAETSEFPEEQALFVAAARRLLDRFDIDDGELGDLMTGPLADHQYFLPIPQDWAGAVAWALKRLLTRHGVSGVRYSRQDPRRLTIRCSAADWETAEAATGWFLTQLATTLQDIYPGDVPDYIYGFGDKLWRRVDDILPREKLYREYVRSEDPSSGREIQDRCEAEAPEESIQLPPRKLIGVGEDADLGRLMADTVVLPMLELE